MNGHAELSAQRVQQGLRAGRRVHGKLLLRTGAGPIRLDLREETFAGVDVERRKVEEAVAALPHAHVVQTAGIFAAHGVPVSRTLDHIVGLVLFDVLFKDGGDGIFR